MTLIIGTKCSGGLVLAADRKMMRGGESDFADKIYHESGLVLAFEGLTGIRDDFLLLLQTELAAQRGFDSLYQAKLLIEDIVASLSARYAERLGEDAYLGALLAGLSRISSGPAELYNVHPQGYGESVRYRCVGHGADYAHTLARFVLTPELSVEESAYRAAFVIAWVSESVDSTVGGTPQVAMIHDDDPEVHYLSEAEVARSIDHVSNARTRLPELLGLTGSQQILDNRR